MWFKKCQKIENSRIEKLGDLKTIGIKLTSEHAIHFTRVLLTAS